MEIKLLCYDGHYRLLNDDAMWYNNRRYKIELLSFKTYKVYEP